MMVLLLETAPHQVIEALFGQIEFLKILQKCLRPACEPLCEVASRYQDWRLLREPVHQPSRSRFQVLGQGSQVTYLPR